MQAARGLERLREGRRCAGGVVTRCRACDNAWMGLKPPRRNVRRVQGRGLGRDGMRGAGEQLALVAWRNDVDVPALVVRIGQLRAKVLERMTRELVLHAQEQHVQQYGDETARHGGHTDAMGAVAPSARRMSIPAAYCTVAYAVLPPTGALRAHGPASHRLAERPRLTMTLGLRTFSDADESCRQAARYAQMPPDLAGPPGGVPPVVLMTYRLLCRRRRLLQRLVCGVTAVVFTILVSVAVSHLHVGADQDAACAVCAAFAGKLEGASTSTTAPPTAVVVALRIAVLPRPQIASSALIALPPSCGPPLVA